MIKSQTPVYSQVLFVPRSPRSACLRSPLWSASQMLGQFAQKNLSLVAEKTLASRRLLQEPDCRRTIEPFPVAHATAQNCPQERPKISLWR